LDNYQESLGILLFCVARCLVCRSEIWFHLQEYIELHGQQNIKSRVFIIPWLYSLVLIKI